MFYVHFLAVLRVNQMNLPFDHKVVLNLMRYISYLCHASAVLSDAWFRTGGNDAQIEAASTLHHFVVKAATSAGSISSWVSGTKIDTRTKELVMSVFTSFGLHLLG